MPGSPDDAETILEYVVRDRLSRPQIRELLDAFGSSTSGNKEEMAERLLAVRGLKVQEALKLLDIEDLKRVQKRFGVPPPSSSGGLMSMVLGDDKGDFVKRITKFAEQQRDPRPKSVGASPPGPAPAPQAASAPTPSPESPRVQPPIAREPPSAARPSPTQNSAGPSFEDVAAFVESYRFRSQWPDEAHYEAELFGALTARFLPSAVSRQERKNYGTPDITVKAAVLPSGSIPTFIEMKVPENPGQVRAIEGQVKKYLEGGATNLIVVIVGHKMRSVAPLDEMAATLEGMNVRVARKYS